MSDCESPNYPETSGLSGNSECVCVVMENSVEDDMRQAALIASRVGARKSGGHREMLARKRQNRVVVLWFFIIALTFLAVLMIGGGARAAVASGGKPATHPVPGSNQVSPDAVQCLLTPSGESGMVSITIGNSSSQAIQKDRIVYYEMGVAKDEPLHGVRAPTTVLIGGQFSITVPVQGDLHPGACKAWIYKPLQGLQLSQ